MLRTVLVWFCICVCIISIECTEEGRTVTSEWFKPFNVSYDHRALILDGKRRMLISAGIHYPRATPEVHSPLYSKSQLFNFKHCILIFACLHCQFTYLACMLRSSTVVYPIHFVFHRLSNLLFCNKQNQQISYIV